MKKLRIIFAMILSAALFLMLPLSAGADFGPKPYIKITFTNTSGGQYYSAILAKGEFQPGGGDRFDESMYDGEWFQKQPPGKQEAVRAFVEHTSPEGYNLFQYAIWDSSKSIISWNYMPPDDFVLLVYLPESGRVLESDVCHTYAFASCYTADLSDLSGGEISVDQRGNVSVQPIFPVGTWLLEFAARALITIAVELVVALIFGYWEKRALLFFMVVNLATQILLNIILSIVNINYGILLFGFAYIIGELVVVTLEAVLYAKLIGKYSRHKGAVRAVFYAICANLASLLSGFIFTLHFTGSSSYSSII